MKLVSFESISRKLHLCKDSFVYISNTTYGVYIETNYWYYADITNKGLRLCDSIDASFGSEDFDGMGKLIIKGVDEIDI